MGIWISAIVWLSEQNASEKGHLRFRVGIREDIQLGHSGSAVIIQKSSDWRQNFALLITVIRIA